MRFFAGGIINFLTRILLAALGLVNGIIISRVLDPEGRGLYSLVALVMSMLFLVGNFGLNSSTIYYAAKTDTDKHKLLANSFVICFFLPLVLGTGFFMLAPLFNKLLAGMSSKYILMAVSALPFYFFYNIFNGILLGTNRVKEYNFVRIFESIAILVFIFSALYIFKLGLKGAVLGWWLSIFFTAILAVVLVFRKVKFKFEFFPAQFKETARFGIKSYFSNLSQFFNYRLDMFLVSMFTGWAGVGIYAVAVSLGEILWFLPGSMALLLLPKTSATPDKERNSFTPVVCRVTFAFTIITGVLLFIFSDTIVKLLFGEKFIPSILPLLILIPGTIIYSIQTILASDIAGRGKPEYNTYISFGGLTATIILDLLLIPSRGVSGAAFASSVSYIATTAVTIAVFLKMSGGELGSIIFIKRRDIELFGKSIGVIKK